MENIKLIRFLTGDEVIVEIVSDTDKNLVIKNPLRVLIMPSKNDPKNPQIGFVPWAEFSADKEFTLNKDHITTISNPIAEFLSQYKSVFTGLAIPTTKIIMPS